MYTTSDKQHEQQKKVHRQKTRATTQKNVARVGPMDRIIKKTMKLNSEIDRSRTNRDYARTGRQCKPTIKQTNQPNPNQQTVISQTTSKPPANQTNRSACNSCRSKTKSGTNRLAGTRKKRMRQM
jgi:hypothetical protein